MAPETLLAVRGLVVAYGNIEAVKGVDLEVRRGEFVAVLGPNGAGKSTLMKAAAGVLAPRAGTITLDGRDLARVTTAEMLGAVLAEGDADGAYERLRGLSFSEPVGDGLALHELGNKLGLDLGQCMQDVVANETRTFGRHYEDREAG